MTGIENPPERSGDFRLSVTNWSKPRPNRGIASHLRSLARNVRSRWRAKRSVAIEWDVDFDSYKPAVPSLPIPPWEARVVKKGRCLTCWGRLVGRIDRRTRKFTGIRCVVCGKTIEGEAAAHEHVRMISEGAKNGISQATGSAVEYD